MTTGLSINDWLDQNKPRETLRYKSGQSAQITFVIDNLIGLFASNYEEYESLVKEGVTIISSHYSKSIPLPVFKLTLPDGTFFVLRCNFYDWKVSVSSSQGVYFDFLDLFNPESEEQSTYCEGFPEELVFGSYAKNQKQFTIGFGSSNYEVYVFFKLFARWWKTHQVE